MNRFCFPVRCRRSRRDESGHTLAEAMAATLVLALLAPVALEAVALAHRAGVLADRQRTAVALADAWLTEVVETGAWTTLGTEGDFGDDWPEYVWSADVENWSLGAMRRVTVRVHFLVQGHEHAVRLSTLVAEEALTP